MVSLVAARGYEFYAGGYPYKKGNVMKKAIWFARLAPTAAQVEELAGLGYELAEIDKGMALGALPLKDEDDARDVGQALLGLCADAGADTVFGVFAAPLLVFMYHTAKLAVWEGMWPQTGTVVACVVSWGHKFVKIGRLSAAAFARPEKKVVTNGPRCGKCGVEGVKIYRVYSASRDPETDRCTRCMRRSDHRQMVPCILDPDGRAWGYTSAPQDAVEEWRELPAKRR